MTDIREIDQREVISGAIAQHARSTSGTLELSDKVIQAIESNGFAIVPVEPSGAAIVAIHEYLWNQYSVGVGRIGATELYKAMLTAYKEGK